MKQSLLLAIGIASAFLWMENGAVVQAPKVSAIVPDAATVVRNVAVVEKKISGILREVTAYNVGVREQTSDTPCIGAGGHNLCELLERGVKVCAANFVPLGTVLKIEKHGEYVVLDRTHRRFSHRVDIAMKEDEVDDALRFGLQKRLVEARF
jgi:3D (Asp-Asp-Asp) domain-containing protein